MSTPRLNLPVLAEGQASQELTHNTAIYLLDAMTQLALATITPTTTPPGSPANGDCYIVNTAATGAWSGQDGKLAVYAQGWYFVPAVEGMRVWVKDTDVQAVYNGSAWVTPTTVANATGSGDAHTQLNALLTQLRNLGVIDT